MDKDLVELAVLFLIINKYPLGVYFCKTWKQIKIDVFAYPFVMKIILYNYNTKNFEI